jgi:uncharacterized heparinase superfamily protein
LSRWSRIGLAWHTVRYLRPVQIYGRLWSRRARVTPSGKARPPLHVPSGGWLPPATRQASLIGPQEYCFVNVRGNLSEVGWNGPQRDRLWRYNQHYFDDLNAQDSQSRREWHIALLRGWVRGNPPVAGTGWEPYPLSLRIVNWLKWHWSGETLPAECVDSLAMQVRHLYRRVEWHLLGNHILANAKALVFAGISFDGAEAQRWLEKGSRILTQQLSEQILADGGHFELSPMYHSVVLEDMLDLINAAQASGGRIPELLVSQWQELACRMCGWLLAMTHPDGEIAFFNDAATGIAATPGELVAYASRLGVRVSAWLERSSDEAPETHLLGDSGYFRLYSRSAVALLDVARIGPDCLPGHAHADTLSFELSIHDHRIIVNGGTSRYGTDAQRLAERSTAAHSTVEVDGQNSSEVWSGFRVARRARPFDLYHRRRDGTVVVACSHDGYRRLSGHPVHRRTWEFSESSMTVSDTVSARRDGAIARFLLHPAVEVSTVTSGRWELSVSAGVKVGFDVLEGDASLVEARYAPEFGVVRATTCIAVQLRDGQSRIKMAWA